MLIVAFVNIVEALCPVKFIGISGSIFTCSLIFHLMGLVYVCFISSFPYR
jgi:hypothetical protein